ncbi:zinc transporter 11-like [Diospyros lotus]|uniref:zinc transporter 11-like n=1 Tax=Diospyros lotus TaxID=55363 RepID=UPI00225A67E3|nr:zinc transporter 11-like [Diospyros lotus]
MPDYPFTRFLSLPVCLSVRIIDRVARSDLSCSSKLYEMQSQPSIDTINLSSEYEQLDDEKREKGKKKDGERGFSSGLRARVFWWVFSFSYSVNALELFSLELNVDIASFGGEPRFVVVFVAPPPLALLLLLLTNLRVYKNGSPELISAIAAMYRLFFLLLLLVLSAAAHGGHDDSDLDADASVDTSKPNLRESSLILVKIWCLIIVFSGTFSGGMSLYFMNLNEGFLVLGTQFAGGVFLGMALMHFLSDSNETFGDLTTKEYPFAFMLASAGYLLTMLSDCLISHVYGKQGNGSRNGDVELQGKTKDSSKDKISESNYLVHDDGVDNSFVKGTSLVTAKSFGDTILPIVALCFNSVFKGIAIGVAETEGDAWKALWNICLHKIFAVIAMGIALTRMFPNRPFLLCVSHALGFAISSPIGVAIGIIIDATTQGVVADWIFAISMGFACGVFVYVSINLLLAKGHSPQKPIFFDTAFYRFLATLLGVGVIAIMMIWDT